MKESGNRRKKSLTRRAKAQNQEGEIDLLIRIAVSSL